MNAPTASDSEGHTHTTVFVTDDDAHRKNCKYLTRRDGTFMVVRKLHLLKKY